MSDTNKSYRIRTNANITEGNGEYLTINADLVQDYDTFDILSVSLDSVDAYKLHNANYGVVVGRVLANNGFGIPNAKLSIFIERDTNDSDEIYSLYPYSTIVSQVSKYNLLPDEKVSDCHQVVGTFPNKRYLLDNDIVIEVFEKYYKYTTRTNNAGDYLFCGIPTGNYTMHMDLDLSDCGILSQRPRDFVYKGYTIEQFENPNMFKTGTPYEKLSQIFTQNRDVYVRPFWGNSSLGETIGITRADINVSFTFEPTCVFIGSVISDSESNGISHKCIPAEHMGDMDELTTGEGTIEMIRKTASGDVEEFQIKGNQLINENGIWCYQIPMNLDYMMTDEYGNMVPTDNPDKGIPTRTRVRFRVSMSNSTSSTVSLFRAKALVPNNPLSLAEGGHEEYDYEFGSLTRDDSFRDLFWNNVYSVKSFIPRFQKSQKWKEKKFSGIKHCNYFGANNPMPYNNIRINMPFMFKVMCAIIKCFILITSIFNTIISLIGNGLADIGNTSIPVPVIKFKCGVPYLWYEKKYFFKSLYKKATQLSMSVIKDGLCPDLENWYFSPMFRNTLSTSQDPPSGCKRYDLLKQTFETVQEEGNEDDPQSYEDQNRDESEEAICLTVYTDYLISCVEMNLAQEYKVINFDFYNDWINGTIYFPRWEKFTRPKKKFLGITIARAKVRGCMDDSSIFSKSRRLTQQCSIGYTREKVGDVSVYTNVKNPISRNKKSVITKANNMHKSYGLYQRTIFCGRGGICHEHLTSKGLYAYYLKPCEWTDDGQNKRVNLFATDIILLGSLNDCDLNGIPQAFKHVNGTSYIMPTNLALTNLETTGPLYANSKGTMCTKSTQTTESELINDDKGVSVVDITVSGISSELGYYSATTNANKYDSNEPSDTIAMTEAAGISWNWTGPGQGNYDSSKMYQPGGHFLGLSCVNSQTNLKSCLNLERICEVGSTLSQRKEDVRKISADGELSYLYSVPTGFISANEINDGAFRTMFSTMNHNRLLATKRNPETGYKIYDFSYLKPINFGGEFQNVVDDSSQYNRPVAVAEESKYLSQYGIAEGATRDDYDSEETIYTQTRTIESPSLDYYLFRMGLTYEDLANKGGMQNKAFLYMNGNTAYMPQYQNSFYFYFGLKNGATALEEFNKQFFSNCETSTLIGTEPKINITAEYIPCQGGTIYTTVYNLETPYRFVGYANLNTDNVYTDITDGNSDSIMIEIGPNLKYGRYSIKIIDAEGTEFIKEVNLGEGTVSMYYETVDFNSSEDRAESGTAEEISEGGYIKYSNIVSSSLKKLYGKDGKEDGGTGYSLVIETDGYTAGGSGETITRQIILNDTDENIVYLKYADIKYNVYIIINNCSSDRMLITTFKLDVSGGIKLLFGNNNNSSCDVEAVGGRGSILSNSIYSVGNTLEWWKDEEFINKNENWMLRISLFYKYGKDNREESFSDNLYAKNGEKVIWGSPQNIVSGITSGRTIAIGDDSAETYTFIDDEYESLSLDAPGHSLDDSEIYYPTYPVSGGIRQYSAIAYNGTIVCGKYCYKYSYNYETSAEVYTEIDSSKMADGYGCVFKPIPYGDLIFGIWHKGGMYYLKKSSATGLYSYAKLGGATKDDGIIYPSFVFPILNRPFYANANFYILHTKRIDQSISSDGASGADLEDFETYPSVELEIHNGVTYDGKFSEESMVMGEKVEISTSSVDSAGISENEDRITLYSKYNLERTSESVDCSYDITEGCPEDSIKGMASEISNDVYSEFCNTIYYKVSTDYLNVYIDNVAASGENYYLCDQDLLGINFIKKTDYAYVDYENGDDSGLRIFAAYYTSKAENVSEGTFADGTFWNPSNNKVTYTKHNHDNTTEDETIELDDDFQKSMDDLYNGDYAVKPYRSYTLYETPTLSGDGKEITWYQAIMNSMSNQTTFNENAGLNPQRKCNTGKESLRLTGYDTGHTLFVVGVIENKDENGGYTRLFKIYPNLVKVSKPKLGSGVKSIVLSQYEIISNAEGTEVSVSVTADSTYNGAALIITPSDSSWITVTENYSRTSGSTVYKGITVKVYQNAGDEERNGCVNFYYDKISESVQLTVTQYSMEKPKVVFISPESVYFEYNDGEEQSEYTQKVIMVYPRYPESDKKGEILYVEYYDEVLGKVIENPNKDNCWCYINETHEEFSWHEGYEGKGIACNLICEQNNDDIGSRYMIIRFYYLENGQKSYQKDLIVNQGGNPNAEDES